ncbi:hypothetical protein [Treponema sp. J25]|uniref:hypothetical protein n=1 Tax=Treponema sp. J25 TaxID=2094121 RepID=UPI00104ED4D4|nr:hypothetical protein [Treponema sp. J25]TCW60079.1 hypothetical protein C5O22_13455 [Treponema sp. J25]
MKMKQYRWPLAGQSSLLLVLFAFTLSCELLKLDVFPSYLGNSQGLVQLDSYLQAAGADPSLGDLGFMVFLDGAYQGTSYRYLGLVWHQVSAGPLLLFFDGDTLAFRKSLANLPAGAYLGITADGRLISGGPISETSPYILIDPRSLQEDPLSNSFSSGSSFSRAWVVVAPDSGTPKIYLVSSNTNTLWYCDFSDVDTKTLGSVSAAFYLVDLLKVGDTLWFLIKNETDKTVSPYGVSNFSSFGFQSAYGSPTAPLPRIPLGNDGRAWISPGGVITVQHDDGVRLSRYSLDEGSKLDEFAMPNLKDGVFAFAADGRRWACYDRNRRRLYLLRTWW